MKKIKKFFLIGIFFLIILLLQIFFSEKNFAKTEKTEKTEIYDEILCKNDINKEMIRLVNKKRLANHKIFKEIGISLRDKSEVISYNFRALSCDLESLCMGLQNFMFYGGDGKKKNKTDFTGNLITSFCEKTSFDFKAFAYCSTKNTKDFEKINNFCNDKKDTILFGEEVNGKRSGGEYEFTEDNFAEKSKMDKVNFLSARIYDLNEKMRGLSDRMSRLKIAIVDIVNRIVCTAK